MPAVVQWVSRDYASIAFETPLHPSVFEHLRVHHASLFGPEPEHWVDPRCLPRACEGGLSSSLRGRLKLAASDSLANRWVLVADQGG